MRSSVAALFSKATSSFFALALAVGLVPVAAFAEPAGDAAAPQSSESAVADSDMQVEAEASASEDGAEENGGESTDPSQHVISSEGDEVPEAEKSRPSNEGEDTAQAGENPNPATLPAGEMINQEMELDTVVVQAESTRSFFLAQTLESTRTVPVVSAKLPLDTNAAESSDPSQVTSTEDSDSDPSQHVISTEPSDSEASGEISSDGDAAAEDGAEGGDDSDEPDLSNPTIASESTVIGSFEYRGITYAIEPGGESVAVVAADYAKLPSDFIAAQTIVLPSVVSPDGVDYYSVTRIADDAFASLTVAAAAAADNGESAGADSDIQAQAEACAYGDQATSEPVEGDDAAPQVVSGVVSLSDDPSQHVISNKGAEADPTPHVISSDTAEASDSQAIPTEGNEASSTDVISNKGAEADPTPHVISSGASEAGGVEKSRPSSEGEGEALTDSTEAESIGITVITIPASITTIEDDAFAGFDTLQYVIVSEDNPTYSMYDGCLYDKPLSSLLLIPEGRLGAVRVAPSATTIDPEVFSHCALDAVIADPDSAASQLLSENGESYKNGRDAFVRIVLASIEVSGIKAFDPEPYEEMAAAYEQMTVLTSDSDLRSGSSNEEFLERGSNATSPADLYLSSYQGNGIYIFWDTASYSTLYARCDANHIYDQSYGDSPVFQGRMVEVNRFSTVRFTGHGSLQYVFEEPKYYDELGFVVTAANRATGITKVEEYDPVTRKFTDKPVGSSWSRFNNTGRTITTYLFLNGFRPRELCEIEITWNAGEYGGKIRDLDDVGAPCTNGSVKEYAPLDDLDTPAIREDLIDLPESAAIQAPSGFTFKGWATQAKDDAGNLLTDEFGNRVLNIEYTRYDPATNTTFTETCEGGNYLTEESGTNLVIEEDTTFYAVFAIDLTWDASTYGGSFADNGSTDARTQEVIYGNKVAVPAVKPDDGEGWSFAGWATRQKDASGNLVADADALDGVKLNPYITSSRDGTVTVTEGDVGYADASENARYYAVWSIAPAWSRMEGALDSMTIDASGVPTSVVYGTRVTAPSVESPASHHFDKWVASDGTESVEVADEHGNVTGRTIVVKAPSITAHWAPNTRDVVLNGNGGITADQTVWSEYDKQMSLYVSTGSGDSAAKLAVPTREGYEFAGYWTTRYTEDAARTEDGVPLTDGGVLNDVVPKQYYGVEGGQLTSLTTWDITNDAQQLFAHWKYTVQLKMNAYNSDGEVVLNSDRTDFGATMTWPDGVSPDTGTFTTEQKGYNTDNTFTIQDKKVEGDSAATPTLTLPSYEFSAIAGAPIQLPSFGARRGYDGGRAWGRTMGSHGAATGIVGYADGTTQVTAALDPGVLTRIAGEGTPLDATDDRYALVLCADWSGGTDDSGRAKRYQVELKATYDGFASTNAALDSQTVTVAYDAPIPVDELQASAVESGRFLEYESDGAINYVDATKDAAGASRNLVLRGFYTKPAEVPAPAAGSKPYLVVKDGAFANDAVAFREVYAEGQSAIPLYAWWTYNTMSVTFDLQGGTVGGKTATELPDGALTIESVTSHSATPDLNGTLSAATARAGYEFAGWWNTPYNEKTPEVIGGVKVTPTCYYDAGLNKVGTQDGQPVWLEYTDTTLYAHWKYTIEFATQLPATDIADVSIDVVKETNEDARAAGVVPLLSATDGTRTDLYGNAYTASEADKDSNENSLVKTLQVKAIAGAPVQLPSAQNRRALGTGEYERIGYDATWEWHTAAGATDEASCLALDSDKFTALDDSWTNGYEGEGSVPCKLGRSTFSDSQNRLVLYADWSRAAKQFAVELFYDYDMPDYERAGVTDTLAYDSDHATPSDLMTVTYDRNDYAYADGSDFTDLASVDSSGAHATGRFGGEDFNNLDFAGVTTAKKALFDSSVPGAVYPDPNVDEVYWNAQGKLLVRQFRAIRGADVDVYWSGDPFPMYVAWAQPTRELTFNMFDRNSADDANTTVISGFGDGGATKLTLMKDDAVDKAAVSSQLDELATWIRAYENATNYEFGGFWTAPGDYAAYAEHANGETDKTAKPTCYYVMDGAGKLVAARPTDDGWLTSDNTSSTWLEDKATTLYAHWKYAIDFRMSSSDAIPGTATEAAPKGVSDLLLFGSPTDGFGNATADAVPFDSVDDKGIYTDERGKVTFGAPLTLPVDQDPQGMNVVSRVRDFGRSSAAYGYQSEGRGYTGYDFRAWASADGPSASGMEGVDAATGQVSDHSKLRPQQAGKLTLYAQWTARDFELTLNHYPQTMYGNVITPNSVKASGAAKVTVPYDGVYSGAIASPVLYGFTYLGYFATDRGMVGTEVGEQQKVSGAGVQYFAPPTSIGDPGSDGLSASTGMPWFAPVSAESSGNSAVLYAYYARNGYTMHFSMRDELDGTLQEPSGKIGGNDRYEQVWYYGDVLREVAGDGHVASGSQRLTFPDSSEASSFWRPGYAFDGWYFYPAERDSMTDEQKRALRADKSNRVYVYRVDNANAAVPVGQAGVFTYAGQDEAGADDWMLSSTVNTWRTTDLFDAEHRYTLYAGWTPKTYQVTFDTNYQNGTSDKRPVRTFSYEQMLTAEDLLQLGTTGAPYEFIGWNSARGATEGITEGWLFDKSSYAPDKQDTTVGQPDSGYPIMGSAGGRFMPANYKTSALTFYGIWKKAPAKNVVLFAGNHGALQRNSGSGYEDVPFTVISHDSEDGINLDDTYLQNSLQVKKRAEQGYGWLGWVELSPMQMGAASNDSYAGLDRTRDEAIAWAAAHAADVNGLDLSDAAVFFPTKFNVMDNALVYKNPYNAEGPTFRDVYLVAVYGKVTDYGITLDLGAASAYGDWDEAAGVEMGARLPESGRNGFVEDYGGDNIRYTRGFDIDAENFTLPTPVSSMHDFLGWYKDAACSDGQKLTDAELTVDVAAYIGDTGRAHRTTYYAKFAPKKYAVVFKSDHEGMTEADADGEDVTLRQLGYHDTFTLPYPATRGEGQYFDYWSLERVAAPGEPTMVGAYKAETSFDLRKLLVAIRSNGTYNGSVHLGKVAMVTGDDGVTTITFDGAWNDAINVAVPVQVLVQVDLENGNVKTADNLQLSTVYDDDAADARKVEVVSLRYDRLNVRGEHDNSDTSDHVFAGMVAGSGAGGLGGSGGSSSSRGKVFLSVYPDLQLVDGTDSGWLFSKDNVDAETGALREGVVPGSPNEPLLIDLAEDAVFAEEYPFVVGTEDAPSDAYYDGLYGSTHGSAESEHGLTSHGFRAFNVSDPLPIRYSLLFSDGAQPSDYPLLRGLGAQSDTAYPIAHLYYTIALAPLP